MPGLPISNIVNVPITLAPQALPMQNFGSLMIIGPSTAIINTAERFRLYNTISQVQADFGTTTPESIAATLFFGQSPQPALLYIGRWAQTATHASLHGAAISPANQALAVWTVITNGSMAVTIDGTPRSLTALNFSGASSLNGVAATIQAALPAGATCVWNANYSRFELMGVATGTAGTITNATPVGSGVDISTLSGLSAAAGASAPCNGIVAETPLACVSAMISISNDWYGATFVPTNPTDITDSQYQAVAGLVEAANPARIFGISSQAAAILDPTQTSDLCSVLQGLGYEHTFVQYSSTTPYSVCSMFGRAFTVDFTANNSTITLKFKQEPGVTAENLNSVQSSTASAKNCNYFVNYANGVAIIQEGVMCGGYFIDERIGLDWLQNNIQTRCFNILYQSPTKLPQTDAGNHVLKTGIEAAMSDGVNNGLVAPGLWTGPGFGQLSTGQVLPAGFYVYQPPVSAQSPSARSARKSVTFQAAAKLAGAIHFVGVSVSVNR